MAQPAWWNEADNPYQAVLHRELEKLGFTVEEFSVRELLLRLRVPEIVHLHWPEWRWGGRSPRALVRTVLFLLALVAARARGSVVVWTAHNLAGHDRAPGPVDRVSRYAFARLVVGWISLSDAAAAEVVAAVPALRSKPRITVPHGPYAAFYPDGDRDSGRRQLGMTAAQRVLLIVGQQRRYKGADGFIRIFAGISGPDLRLVVAGDVKEESYAAELAALAAADQRVLLIPSRVENSALASLVLAADVVVLPYRRILNSGVALLALSLGRPILCPPAPTFLDLQRTYGTFWVRVFDQPSPESIASLLDLPEGAAAQIDWPDPTWALAAAEHARFYRELSRGAADGVAGS